MTKELSISSLCLSEVLLERIFPFLHLTLLDQVGEECEGVSQIFLLDSSNLRNFFIRKFKERFLKTPILSELSIFC